MEIKGQPHNASLGDELETLLVESSYDHCYIISAYVKVSGVSRIEPYLDNFRNSGGSVSLVAGIDHKITTKQALEMLLPVVDDFFVFHSESFSQTFHPKVYAIEQDDVQAVLFVGSNNLTAGGLYTNYEAFSKFVFDLRRAEDVELFADFKTMFEQYSNPDSDLCTEVDQSIIDELANGGYLGDESSTGEQVADWAAQNRSRERMFGTEQFQPPPAQSVTISPGEVPELSSAGEGFWKKLSNNDVSLSSSPGQMIIPKQFLGYFPPLTDWEVRENNARQADSFFDVVFKDTFGGQVRVENVRVIHYVPSPDHARPNDEVRFTFRNRDILTALSEDDILVFRETNDPGIWFIIEHIPVGSSEYGEYPNRRYDSL